MTSERGHRIVPHTADIRIEAWAPTREACLAEAVAAMVGSFADIRAQPERSVSAELAADTDDDRLVAVLDQVIYVLDTENAVAAGLTVDIGSRMLRVVMPVADLEGVEIIGSVPKAVALSGLSMDHRDGRWCAAAIIDV